MKNRGSIILLRCLLFALICLQLYMIFGFSKEDAQKSTESSERVTEEIAKIVIEDYEKLPVEEQKAAVKRIDPPVRKIAHATEFGILGGLALLFFLTFRRLPLWLSPILATLSAALAGAFDELHQTFVPGRSGEVRDVLIDTSGALLVILVVFLIFLLIRAQQKKIVLTKKVLPAPISAKIAILADLHGEYPKEIEAILQEEKPDLILLPGDLTDRENLESESDPAFAFLQNLSTLAPTYYSLGNHEVGCYRKGFCKNRTPIPLAEKAKENLAKAGIFLLDDRFFVEKGISICGLSSNGGKGIPQKQDLLHRFSAAPGFKILLCHHPEQFAPLVRSYPEIDLTIAGHAHGGQWRIFGHGIYAPDQGLFPSYTSGFYFDNRLLVSRGLGDHTIIPRFFNRRELVILELTSE
ncbi:MAG: VanZ family protein [Clostridia bacterium]|nr:VanZ family protein [Clostridia bacterium]